MSYNVIIRNVVKEYGDFKAVNNVNFTIKKGELFTLLGPSGCGKTTLLRMIAGFNSIESGEVLFDAKVINNIEPHKRNIGMVFQNYAIFPHMTVYKNIEYGLKARKINGDESKKRIDEALNLVQISQYKDRQPSQLSGGQQQRVALARAVVIQPDVLLMDEPLSNLDAKLRIQMRSDIKKLQRKLGVTTIYVTHDQEEALAISDRIAIMRNGKIEQIGNPEEIYKKPANTFVAGFIGTSNFCEGRIVKLDQDQTAIISILNKKEIKVKLSRPYEGKVILALRPESITLENIKDGELKGEILLATFLGDYMNYEVQLENGQIIEVNEYTKDVEKIRNIGDTVSVKFNVAKINLYDESGEEALI